MMRIISGKRRGAILLSPKGKNTRPTSGRVKEALFNILHTNRFNFALKGKLVVDAFAGTGALGLEALSRGAGKAVFIENDTNTLKVLKANIESLEFQRDSQIIVADASRISTKASSAASLVLMDPPYNSDLGSCCIESLNKTGWIDEETLVVAEQSSKNASSMPPWLNCIKTEKYGAACLSFFIPIKSTIKKNR